MRLCWGMLYSTTRFTQMQRGDDNAFGGDGADGDDGAAPEQGERAGLARKCVQRRGGPTSSRPGVGCERTHGPQHEVAT